MRLWQTHVFILFAHVHHYPYCTCIYFRNSNIRFIDVVFFFISGISTEWFTFTWVSILMVNSRWVKNKPLSPICILSIDVLCVLISLFFYFWISFSHWIVEFPSTISLDFVDHCSELEEWGRLINLKSYHDFLTRFHSLA